MPCENVVHKTPRVQPWQAHDEGKNLFILLGFFFLLPDCMTENRLCGGHDGSLVLMGTVMLVVNVQWRRQRRHH